MTAAALEVRFTSDTRNAEAGMDRLNNKVRGLDGSFKKTLGSVAGGMILGGIVQGFARSVGGLVQGALDFESQMANVNSIAQLTGGEIDILSGKVNELAGATAQAPQVLAAGLYQIYSAGFSGAEAIDVLTASANAATAGLTTTDVAATAVTAVINAYTNQTYDAATASDILFQIVNDGVITFDQIAKNMGNTGALANAMGLSFEEVGAAYAQMTLQGIDAAQAETQIAGLLKAALNPTQALTDATIAYGYASVDALVAAEGMPGLLKAIDKAQIDGTASLRELVATDEAANAARILSTDGAKAYNVELERMKHASDGIGATNKALAKQMESSSFRIKQMKIAVQQAATVLIGAFSPAIQAVAQGMTWLVMNGLIPAVEWISKIVGIGAQFIGFFKDVFGAATSVNSILDKIFGDGSSLAVGLPLAATQFERTTRPLKEFVRSMLLLADSAGHVLRAFQEGGVSGALDEFRNQWDRIKTEIADIAHLAIDVVVDVASWALGAVPDLWDWLMGELGVTSGTQVGDGTGAMPRDVQAPVTLWDVGVNVGSWALGLVPDLWNWLMGEIGVTSGGNAGTAKGMPGGPPMGGSAPVTLWDVGVNIGSWAIDAIADLGEAVFDKVLEWWPTVKDAIGDTWDAALEIGEWLITGGSNLFTAVSDKIEEWWPTVKDSMGNAWDATLEIGTWLIEGGSNLFTAVSDKIAEWWPVVKASIGNAWDATLGIGTWLIEGGSALFTAVSDKLKEWWPIVQSSIGDAWEATLSVGTWLIEGGGALFTAFSDKLEAWWPIVQAGIGDAWEATLSIGSWVVKEGASLFVAVYAKVMEWHKTIEAIPIGAILVDVSEIAIESIAGWASTAVASVQTWLDTNPLSGFTQIIKIDAFDPTFEAVAVGDYTTAVQTALTADPIKITPEIELDIKQAVENWVAGKGGGGEGGGGDDFGFGDVWNLVTAAIQNSMIIADPVGTLSKWVFNTIVPDSIAVLRAGISGIFEGLTMGQADYQGGALASSIIGPSILQTLQDDIVKMFKDLPGNIVEAVGELKLDIPIPKLPAWLDTDWSWITGPIETLTGYIADLLGLKSQAEAATASTSAPTMGVSEVQNAIGGPYIDPNQYGPGSVVDVPSAPIPVIYKAEFDATGVPPTLQSLVSGGAPPTIPPMKATLGLDIQQAGSDMAKAMQWGLDWDSRTFIADFNSDINQTGLAVANVMQWGLDWDSRVFVADFNADISQAGNAVATAMQWGLDWDGRVFTASFNVDTSGITNAVAVAAQAAADIDALMPHSPAKKGPLSRTPNFSYITDSLVAAMSNMGPAAERGMGDVADRLGKWSKVGTDLAGGSGALGKWRYADGRSGRSEKGDTHYGGPTININAPVYGVEDLENKIVDTYTNKIIPAHEISMRRHDRSWGLSS